MLVFQLCLVGLFGFLGYREADKFGRKYGRTPWGWNPWGWAALCAASLVIGAVCLAIARSQGKKEAAQRAAYGVSYGATPVAVAPVLAPVAAPFAAVPVAAASVATAAPAGQWAPDPSGRHHYRWWDGAQWTAHVSTNGVQGQDPAA